MISAENISSKPVHMFVTYPGKTQINKRTNKQTNTTDCITQSAAELINLTMTDMTELDEC